MPSPRSTMGAHGEGCGVRIRAGMQERGRRRGWGWRSGVRAGWGGYLGREGLPIPQPPHRGPGFARGRAAPAQVGPDVGLGVRDHSQPVGLGCGDKRERGLEPRSSAERWQCQAGRRMSQCQLGRWHSGICHGNGPGLLCRERHGRVLLGSGCARSGHKPGLRNWFPFL